MAEIWGDDGVVRCQGTSAYGSCRTDGMAADGADWFKGRVLVLRVVDDTLE